MAGLHPLWTHYITTATGPGLSPVHLLGLWPQRESDLGYSRPSKSLRIRYIPDQHSDGAGFAVPDGLVSLETSRSWAKIYDNGEARIYEWRGCRSNTLLEVRKRMVIGLSTGSDDDDVGSSAASTRG